MIYRQNKKAFTLIELLVVIAIIGVLSTLVIVALGNSRAKARDAKRLNDLKAMANALELYYANNNQYPSSITPGQPLENGGIVYMSKVPNNPTPYTDGNCPDEEYRYLSNSPQSYSVISCIGSSQGNLIAGGVSVTNNSGLQSIGATNGLVLYLDASNPASYPGSGNTWYDLSGNANNGSLVNSPLFDLNNNFFTFENNTQAVTVAENSFHDEFSDGFTISMWINIPDISTWTTHGLLGHRSESPHYTVFTNKILYLYLRDHSTSGYIGRQITAVNTATHIEGNGWLYLTAVWDGSLNSSGIFFYKNNNLLPVLNYAAGSFTAMRVSSDPINIAGSGFKGSVGSFMVYNKPLSQEDITNNFNSTKGRFGL